MATTKSYKPNQLYTIPLANLQADANQLRKGGALRRTLPPPWKRRERKLPPWT
ncbi:MAG: hypothetical protein NTY64_07160 [Deltaproteobacteria bacterium]|nr:hypothetical protein [Deltaproteobacteria bacterium]